MCADAGLANETVCTTKLLDGVRSASSLLLDALVGGLRKDASSAYDGGFQIFRVDFWIDSTSTCSYIALTSDMYPFVDKLVEREAWMHAKWETLLGEALDIVFEVNEKPDEYYAKVPPASVETHWKVLRSEWTRVMQRHQR